MTSDIMVHRSSILATQSTVKVGRGVFLGLVGITGLYLGLERAGVTFRPPDPANLVPGSALGGFTIYTINGYPSFDASSYRLRVDGLVNHPREYAYSDIRRMTAVEETRYYQCVTGWVVPRPRWRGVRLWDLVMASKPRSQATALSFSCLDNAYTESLTFEQAKQADVLLAYGLNGSPLSQDQGRPLRLVVPGMYGYKFAKWVNRITVTDRVIPGYWENNGYDVDAYFGRAPSLTAPGRPNGSQFSRVT